jgi:thiamine biosynthesis lipoprotein
MFHFLFGRALSRWLQNLAESAPQTEKGPAPEVTFAPPAEAAGGVPSESDSEGESEIVYPRVRRAAMGSLFEVYLAGTDRDSLVGAAEEALDEVERLDRQLSHYREDSDISRLNAHAAAQWVRLEPRLYHLLKRCAQLSAETDGAFDITSGPLVKAWGFHDGEGRIPPDAEIAELLENVGMSRILFDDDDHLVYYTAPKLEINLGAVGKGYALDQAAETLKFYGVRNALMHGGQSTILAMGAPPGADGWELTLRDPRDRATAIQTILLRDEAISTSGNYEQFFEVDGVRYTHILDPRAGRPVQGMTSVSVVAPSAADSDALSTAFFVLGRERTEEYCQSHPELKVIIITETPDRQVEFARIGM